MRLLDVVELSIDLPDAGLAAGTRGTIVDIHREPALAYEVEFVDSFGRTLAIVPLGPDSVRPSSDS